MGTDSQSRRSMGIGSVAADGFTSPDRDDAPRSAPVDSPASYRAGTLPTPAQPLKKSLTQAGLIPLIGELSLRVMRAQHPR